MSLRSNSFGNVFSLTSFGESHGPAMGAIIDGCPAGVVFKEEIMRDFLNRRRPGSSALVSARNENDPPQILSGVFENKTLGTPIAIVVQNKDQKSEDYEILKKNGFRHGHADDLWLNKFSHSDHRGGGRASGRETLARVLAGSVAKMFCTQLYPELRVYAQIESVGALNAQEEAFDEKLSSLLTDAKKEGKSYGGIAALKISHPPQSLGEPIFLKFKSEMAKALMSVGAVVGVELGAGFESASAEGSVFHSTQNTENNPYGGIRGGITTGEDVLFRIAVKPTSSVLDVAKQGRHDPCILLRALVVFEAMAWLVLADQILMRRLNQL
jgi:chorismate synthase